MLVSLSVKPLVLNLSLNLAPDTKYSVLLCFNFLLSLLFICFTVDTDPYGAKICFKKRETSVGSKSVKPVVQLPCTHCLVSKWKSPYVQCQHQPVNV